MNGVKSETLDFCHDNSRWAVVQVLGFFVNALPFFA